MDIKEKVKAFCDSNGLRYEYIASARPCFVVGHSGFCASDVADEDELQQVLGQCLEEHKQIENVVWESGVLYNALSIDDGPARAAIEEELSRVFDRATLDKIARIFYKHTYGI